MLFLLLLLLVGVLVARRSIRQVPEGSIEIVNMFGKYVRTLQPGPHLLMPWEQIGNRLNTKETPWKSQWLRVKIARGYEVQLIAVIWYQLDSEKAHIAQLRVKNWETSLQEMFVSVLKDVFREVTPAEVESWLQGAQAQATVPINTSDSTVGRTLEQITNSIATLVQQEVDGWGVKVRKVDIQDPTLIPNLAPRENPIRRPVAGAQVGAGPTSVQPDQVTTHQIADKQTIPMTQPQYVPAYPPHSASEIEMLKEWYQAVRTGLVRDPQTIRSIAARFEALANDPNLDFNPLRAAEILYSRARFYEEQDELKRRSQDESIGALSAEGYPSMEELPLKPPPQYSIQPPPPELIEAAESPVTGREEAETIRFAIGKLNDYLLWFLMLLEVILLIEFFLTLIGANPNNLFAGFMSALTFIPLYPFNGIVTSTKLESSGLVNEWSTLIAMVVYFLAFYVLRRFLYILISSPEEPIEDFDLKPPRAFASKFAITQVRSFYQNTRRQFKSWLYFSVFAITLGTLCIASIYLIPYLGKFFPISESTTTVVTIFIAAGSLYILALLSFLQNRSASKQVDSYYIEKLIEAEKISQLTALASRTPVSESQEHINEKIISQILLPLDKEKIGQENLNTVSDEMLKLEQKNK